MRKLCKTGGGGGSMLLVITSSSNKLRRRKGNADGGNIHGTWMVGVILNVNIHGTLIILLRQFVTAMIVLDTWQYFMHRYMHHNKFLYKHIHSQHHRLVVPYAFGALYNHPLEGLLLDTIGGALSFLLSGISPRASTFFFSFATIKTVDDHCGLWLPGNLFHFFFKNNTAYHDVHHQLYGSKYNFSQPFFVMWDRILGTYMPYTLEHKRGGGFEARPAKEIKDN